LFRESILATAAVVLASACAPAVLAGGAAFDLAGPKLAVTVSRGGVTLPIDEVPSLAEHDVLKVQPDLPSDQSTHFVLVLAFLRGSTNPPPHEWFHACQTWQSPCARTGLTVEVPVGAQQTLVLLAPSTPGDVRTMIDAVTGRPGAFVRAAQILRQAGLERSRLDTYLAALGVMDEGERARLGETTRLLARSLALKVDNACLEDLPEAQVACLMRGQDSLVLNDGHSASLVDNLTSGPSADLALVAANTPALGGGYYGPYVASLLNVGKLVSRMRSVQFQYLPAVADAHDDRLALTLNSPPSFHEPYSVLVAALPSVTTAQPPPMRAVSPEMHYCADRDPLVFAIDGAPLAFSTRYLHDVRLHVEQGGSAQDIAVRADAARGGFVAARVAPAAAGDAGGVLRARLRGKWGFDEFRGPSFDLVTADQAGGWTVASDDGLVAGRDNLVHLKGAGSDCIASITAADPGGATVPVQWTATADDAIEVHLSLQHARPGELKLRMSRLGSAQPLTLDLPIAQDVIRVRSIAFSPGDAAAVVRGTHLEQIRAVQVDHQEFVPGALLHGAEGDELDLTAAEADVRALAPMTARAARVSLRDGRRLDSTAVVETARPGASLLDKTVDHVAHGERLGIRLDGNEVAAADEPVRFALHADARTQFNLDSVVDVASADGQFFAPLTIGHGLVLENSQTLVGSFTPRSLLGPLAFGPLRFRVDNGGVPGEWQDLIRLVRLPELLDIDCGETGAGSVRVSGHDLYLLARFGSGNDAARLAEVPEGFTGSSLSAPAPGAAAVSFVLIDDPAHVHHLEPTACRRAAGGAGNSPPRHQSKSLSRSQPAQESP